MNLDLYASYLEEISKDPKKLELIREKYKTPEICRIAVALDGWALEFVPVDKRTPDLCRTAMANIFGAETEEPRMLAMIPHPEVIMEVLPKFSGPQYYADEVFDCIHPGAMDDRIAEYFVKEEASFYPMLPDHLKTPKLTLYAVENGVMLQVVPEDERTESLCRTAVGAWHHNMKWVPEEVATAEFCKWALEKEPFSLEYFPDSRLTRENCQYAIENGNIPYILRNVPFPDMVDKVFDLHCNDYGTTRELLQCIHPKAMTQELAYKVFEKQPELFYNIPEQYKDRKLCETAVDRDGYYIQYVPEIHRTHDLLMKAIESNPYAIRYLPDDMRNENYYMELINKNPQNLKGIPEVDVTYRMCRLALDKTFGKDKNDLSVVNSVLYPLLMLEVVKAHDDPKMIDTILCIAPKDTITPQVALEAMRYGAESFHYLQPRAITEDVAKEAVRNYPNNLAWVPAPLRTPEMYLYTEKHVPGYNIQLPDHVANGDNVYSFSKKIEQLIGRPLRYDQHVRLYNNNETILLSNVINPKNGKLVTANVRYDRQTKNVNIREVRPKKDINRKEATAKVAGTPQKRGKGPKIG